MCGSPGCLLLSLIWYRASTYLCNRAWANHRSSGFGAAFLSLFIKICLFLLCSLWQNHTGLNISQHCPHPVQFFEDQKVAAVSPPPCASPGTILADREVPPVIAQEKMYFGIFTFLGARGPCPSAQCSYMQWDHAEWANQEVRSQQGKKRHWQWWQAISTNRFVDIIYQNLGSKICFLCNIFHNCLKLEHSFVH